MDGASIVPHLKGQKGIDNVFAEYMGEGTVAPMMMIRRGPWKYITCPADPDMLYNLQEDPSELKNLVNSTDPETKKVYNAFVAEAKAKWNMEAITADCLRRQRQRRFCHASLRTGKWTSWDYTVPDNSQDKYIRSHMDLDDLERRARFPSLMPLAISRRMMACRRSESMLFLLYRTRLVHWASRLTRFCWLRKGCF